MTASPYLGHQLGFGLPTTIQFRGAGYELIDNIREPTPKKIEDGIEPMWIHTGAVLFEQRIRITQPDDFFLLATIYAQVCDDSHCHELRSVITNNGTSKFFYEFRGNPELFPIIE